MRDPKDEMPGGQVYEAMLRVVEREVWPRTLVDAGVSRTMPYAQLIEIANREVPEDTVPNRRITIDLLRAATQVCETNSSETNSSESKENLAKVVLEARTFNEWAQTNNVESLAKARKEDPLDTKLTMRGVNGDVELNLGHDPTIEQMVEAMISVMETASGKPADLHALLNHFKGGAAYLEKRIADGATRRLRVVKNQDHDDS